LFEAIQPFGVSTHAAQFSGASGLISEDLRMRSIRFYLRSNGSDDLEHRPRVLPMTLFFPQTLGFSAKILYILHR
jgi:hypothetical protein